MHYYGSMLLTKVRNTVAPLVLGLGLYVPSASAQTPAQVPTELARAPIVNSGMTAELFFVLLLAEVNLQSGEPAAGHSLLLEAARKSNDTQLYLRAVQSSPSGEAALQSARAWRQAQPATRAANRTLLQLLIAMNRIGDSAEPLKAELVHSSVQDLPIAIATIPRYYQQATEKKTAAAVVERVLAEYVIADSPSNTATPAWISIGRMRLLADDLAGAMQAAHRAMQQDASSSGAALLTLELMNRKVAGAEALVKRHLGTKPSAEVRMAYSRILLDGRRYNEALQQLQTLSVEKPEFPEAWLVLGVLQLQEGQAGLAEAALTKYVDLANNQPYSHSEDQDSEGKNRALSQAYLSLAQIFEDRKDLIGAQAWLDKIEGAKTMVSVQSRRASLLARQGKLDEAKKLLRDLPQDNETQARLKLMAEVSLLRESKDNQGAYDLLVQSQPQFPDDPDLQYEQAMLAEKLGQPAEMERLLEKVILAKPDYHHAYNALGFSMADRNVRLPEAKRLIKKALDAAPDDPFIQDSMGWVEFRLGNKTEALKLLEAAYRSKPDVEIAAHLGEVLWSLGQQSRAMLIWREGQKLNPSNETLLETLKRLRVKP